MIWTYETFAITVVGAVPQFTDLSQTLLVQEGLLDKRGITYMGSHIDLVATPTAAPAAGTRDSLVAGIVRANVALTTANLDPSSIAARSTHEWAWLHVWPQPYTAAPVGATQVIEARCTHKLRVKRLLREFSDSLIISFGSQNAAQTWHVDGLVNSLWMVR